MTKAGPNWVRLQGVLFGEGQNVQTDVGIGLALDNTVDHVNEDLTGGADHGFVQVTAEHMAHGVCHGHVHMGIGSAIQGGQIAGQGDDLQIGVIHVGMVLLGVGLEGLQGHIVHGTQTVQVGQLDALNGSQPQQLFHDFLAGIQTDHIGISKLFVFHSGTSLFSHFSHIVAL